jgi:hypothetical protein
VPVHQRGEGGLVVLGKKAIQQFLVRPGVPLAPKQTTAGLSHNLFHPVNGHRRFVLPPDGVSFYLLLSAAVAARRFFSGWSSTGSTDNRETARATRAA